MTLFEYKKKTGMTYAELGHLFGVRGTTVFYWCNEMHTPRKRSVNRVLKATDGLVDLN